VKERTRRGRWFGLALAGLVGVGALVLILAVVWEDATAISVTFVNGTGQALELPDCSTDLATVGADSMARLPIASDHPAECHVDVNGRSSGCVTVPQSVSNKTVIRLAVRHPCQ
jgi:hypothetical protein